MRVNGLGAAAALAVAGAAPASDAVFTVIGPGAVADMSSDGQFVLLNDTVGAAIWSETGGLVSIGETGVAISDDGTIVLGEVIDPDTLKNAAGLWTAMTGWVSLGGLPDEPGCDANLSNPYDLSGVGDVAVGLGWEGCSGRAFRWTEATGMLALPQLGPNSARANAISSDGLVIGGWDEAPSGPRRASVWYDDGTEQLILEGLPGNPEGIGEVWGFSTNGSVAVGQAHADLDTGGGFRYLNGGIDIISPLPGTDPFFFVTVGFAVTDDGALTVGTNVSGFGPFAQRDGILWTEAGGTQLFQDFLVANGAVIPDGLTIASVEAMTPDGNIFAGWALEPPFSQIAWIATLEPPAPSTGAALDIKPGSCPNPFNPRSKGKLPVALLGSEDFDVNEVDLSSLSIAGVVPIMGPPGPAPVFADVAGPSSGEQCACEGDTSPDGYTDLLLKFSTQELAEALDLDGASGQVLVCLTGTLLDGTPFEACDCIGLVPVGHIEFGLGSGVSGIVDPGDKREPPAADG